MNWIKNSAGKPDAILSLTVVAFIVVSINVILGMFNSIDLGSFHLIPKPIDMPTLALYFGLPGTGYVIRRKHKLNTKTEEVVEVEKKDNV